MRAPTEILKFYLDRSEAYDFAACWSVLTEADQQARPLERYLEIMEALPRGSVPTRTLGDERIEGDRATVVVIWQSPDSEGMRALGQQVKAGELSAAEYSRRLRAGELPRKARPEAFELRYENGGWRVFKGFGPTS